MFSIEFFQRLLDFVHGGDALELGILDDNLGLKGPVLRDVDIFVDRRRDEEAAVLAVIRGQVGPAAAEGDAKRRTSDDHQGIFDLGFSIFDWDGDRRRSGCDGDDKRMLQTRLRNRIAAPAVDGLDDLKDADGFGESGRRFAVEADVFDKGARLGGP